MPEIIHVPLGQSGVEIIIQDTAPNAGNGARSELGSLLVNRVGGTLWQKVGSGVLDWGQLSPGVGITQPQADARYLQLTGGTLTGPLIGLSVTGNVSVSGQYQIGGVAAVYHNGGYLRLADTAGGLRGSLSSAGNYFDATTHFWRNSTGATTYATLSATGLSLVTGTGYSATRDGAYNTESTAGFAVNSGGVNGTRLILGTDDTAMISYISSLQAGVGWGGRPLWLQPNGGLTRIGATLNIQSRVSFNAPSDGIVTLTDNAGTAFTRLQFGGTTAAFPALRRTSTGIDVVLADNSAYAPFVAGTINATGLLTASVGLSIANGNALWGTSGVAAPAFTTRSAGAKVVLYPGIGASSADYAIGIESGTLWFGVPVTANEFKWYGGTTLAATLSGLGALSIVSLSVAGSLAANGLINASQRLYVYSQGATGSYEIGAAIEVRERLLVGNTQLASSYAPSIAFHWGNVVASQIGIDTSGHFHLWDGARTASNLNHRALYTQHIFARDITASRENGSGVIYLNDAQTRYLFYDGGGYIINGAPATFTDAYGLTIGERAGYARLRYGSPVGTFSFLNAADGLAKLNAFTLEGTGQYNRNAAAFYVAAAGNAFIWGHANSEYRCAIGAEDTSGAPVFNFYSFITTANSSLRSGANTRPSRLVWDINGLMAYHTGPQTGTADTVVNWTQVFSVSGGGNVTAGGFVRAGTNVYIDQNYGYGLIGSYSATRYQGVFAMGAGYELAVDGTTPGTLYGLAWTHTNNTQGQAKAGLQHQLLVMLNGVTQTAIGSGIWTGGNIIATGSGLVSAQFNAGTYIQSGTYIKSGSYFEDGSNNRMTAIILSTGVPTGTAQHGTIHFQI